jgi:hypothetical protein
MYVISKNIFYLKEIKECGGRLNHGIRNAIQLPHLPHYCEG